MIKELTKSLASNCSGSITTIAALSTPFLLAAMALATDVGTWHVDKTELRYQADASALSAAYLYNRNLTPNEVEAAVEAELIAKGLPLASLNVAIQFPNPGSDLLRLDVSHASEKYLSQIIYPGTVTVSASTVVKTRNYEACVLALNSSASPGVLATGSTSISLNGCVVASNSTAADSITVGGSASLTADCLVTSGGIVGGSNATTACGTQISYGRENDDPFAAMVQPSHSKSSCKSSGNFKPKNTYNLSPGCIKGSMQLKGTVNFRSGVYVLDGTSLKINSGAVVNGSDVTFVLKNGATLDFNGGATINLSAPEDGSGEPYPGMLFWSDSTSSVSHKLSGNSSSSLQGVIYLPGDHTEFTGNSGFDTGCMRMVSDTVSFKGNSSIQSKCATELAGNEFQVAGLVVIVQ